MLKKIDGARELKKLNSNSRRLGKWGEDLAVAYLERHGYKIIARNYRLGHKELDIITSCEGRLTFFEVKTRRVEAQFLGEVTLKSEQWLTLQRAARKYCLKHNWVWERSQLDLLAIEVDYQKKIAKIKHYDAII